MLTLQPLLRHQGVVIYEAEDDDLLARAIGWVDIEAGRAEGTAGRLLMLHPGVGCLGEALRMA